MVSKDCPQVTEEADQEVMDDDTEILATEETINNAKQRLRVLLTSILLRIAQNANLKLSKLKPMTLDDCDVDPVTDQGLRDKGVDLNEDYSGRDLGRPASPTHSELENVYANHDAQPDAQPDAQWDGQTTADDQWGGQTAAEDQWGA